MRPGKTALENLNFDNQFIRNQPCDPLTMDPMAGGKTTIPTEHPTSQMQLAGDTALKISPRLPCRIWDSWPMPLFR